MCGAISAIFLQSSNTINVLYKWFSNSYGKSKVIQMFIRDHLMRRTEEQNLQ